MMSSDEHLEEALAEYNAKVTRLEAEGSHEELLEALVNRSTILMLSDSYVSSITDLDDAVELMEVMNRKGEPVDAGTFVKVYENRGQLSYEKDNESMMSDYMKVSSRLDDLVDGVRHYRYNDIIEMCIDCSQDLIDQGYSENSIPFLDKSIDMLSGRTDLWSQNRIAESYNLLGEAKKNMGLQEEAAEAFTASILAATPIYRKCGLDDEMELVLSYVSRGDIEEKMGDTASMVKDHEAAIDILEEMNAENKLDDTELLVNLHQGIAKVLMDEGNMKDAETHLLRVVDLGMPAMKEAISDLGIKRPDQ